jgi:hypothetical protein
MLNLLDPEFLETAALLRLLDFLRNPFSEKSCLWVDEALPAVGPAYRSMERSRLGWLAGADPGHVARAMHIFRQVGELEGNQLPLASAELSMVQVILLQEELRDHAEWTVRKAYPEAAREPSSQLAEEALHGMAMHEAVFFALAGLFEVKCHPNLVAFSLTTAGKAALRNRTMSFVLEAFSVEALRRDMLMSGALQDAVQLDQLVVRLLDSQFSINSVAQSDSEIVPHIQQAAQLCRWVAVLELIRLGGKEAFLPTAADLSRLGLDIRFMERLLASQSHKLSSDQGIQRTPGGGFSLGGTSLQHAITSCKDAVLSEAACTFLGKKFEQFVRMRIEESGHFIVRPGIDLSGRDKGGAYDCDLIFYQPKRNKLFFVQAKWKRASRTANLEDELKHLRLKNSPITHGVSQLSVLRARLSEPGVMDQVRTSLGGLGLSVEYILSHSHFIVLHTQPFFSAYARDGIAIYEWNLFRNLLVYDDASLPLEDPACVAKLYRDINGIDSGTHDLQVAAREQMLYGFDVRVSGAWSWRRLANRGSVRIVRPYT